MLPFFLKSVVAVFLVLAGLIWTATAFMFTAPASFKWLGWGAACAAIAVIAQLLLYVYPN